MIRCFFFFKQKTAYEMRISDWSSDVCSSDLDVVEHPHHVLDKALVAVPFVPGFEIEAGEAADCGAIIAEMVAPRGQRDLAAQIRGRDLQPQVAVMLGHHAVHLVDEDDVGLAGRQPCLDRKSTRLNSSH